MKNVSRNKVDELCLLHRFFPIHLSRSTEGKIPFEIDETKDRAMELTRPEGVSPYGTQLPLITLVQFIETGCDNFSFVLYWDKPRQYREVNSLNTHILRSRNLFAIFPCSEWVWGWTHHGLKEVYSIVQCTKNH